MIAEGLHGYSDPEASAAGAMISSGVGGDAAKRTHAGLPSDEACADEEDDEDDITKWRWSTSCLDTDSGIIIIKLALRVRCRGGSS